MLPGRDSTEEKVLFLLPFIPNSSPHGGQTLRPQRHGTLPHTALPWAPSGPTAAAWGAVCPSSALLSASLQESVDLGEIMFSLCYLPTAGRLTLTVIKCRNLKAMDITGYSGTSPPQVACTRLPSHSAIRIRKEKGEELSRELVLAWGCQLWKRAT